MNRISIYLDDETEDKRPTPAGWIRCRWPSEVIEYLKKGNVEAISLDHDLGEVGPNARTGYDVLMWVEEKVFLKGFIPPKIFVHTSNPSASIRMVQAVVKINELAEKNKNESDNNRS